MITIDDKPYADSRAKLQALITLMWKLKTSDFANTTRQGEYGKGVADTLTYVYDTIQSTVSELQEDYIKEAEAIIADVSATLKQKRVELCKMVENATLLQTDKWRIEELKKLKEVDNDYNNNH